MQITEFVLWSTTEKVENSKKVSVIDIFYLIFQRNVIKKQWKTVIRENQASRNKYFLHLNLSN